MKRSRRSNRTIKTRHKIDDRLAHLESRLKLLEQKLAPHNEREARAIEAAVAGFNRALRKRASYKDNPYPTHHQLRWFWFYGFGKAKLWQVDGEGMPVGVSNLHGMIRHLL